MLELNFHAKTVRLLPRNVGTCIYSSLQMVQWLAFYCKYSYQISTASGSSLADHEISTHKIVQFATSFIEDNLKQYDQFVHILDEKVGFNSSKCLPLRKKDHHTKPL